MIFVSWVNPARTGKLFIFRSPPEKHQSHLQLILRRSLKIPQKYQKKRDILCLKLVELLPSSSFDIAALILNGQNNFSPAMKMFKT